MIQLLAVLVALSCFSAPSWAQNLDVVVGAKTVTLSLDKMKAGLKSHTIKVDDPVYGKSKEFDGFVLMDVLQMAGLTPSAKADEVVFTATDGYAPNVSFAAIQSHHPYLVYQEHATPGRFGLVAQGKAMLSPWPFYLVWEEGAKLKDEVPWPYQLVKMQAVDWNEKYPKVSPRKAAPGSREHKGFALFKSHCIRCHSINLEGGDVGPELNVPQNVTDYWRPEVLKAFIRNASSFHAKSKMPEFASFKDDEIENLVAYLKAMKN